VEAELISSSTINSDKKKILYLEGLNKNFGGLQAVSKLTLSLGQGELKGLIGPNGAGKSTLFNLISGLHKPNGGRVLMDGADITGKTPDVIVQKGIARTFQSVKLLENKTVLETMMTSFFLSYEYHFLDVIFKTRRYIEQEKEFRHEQMQAGLKKAIDIPLNTMKIADGAWESMIEIATHGNIASKSDVEVGARAMETGIWGAYKNVEINMVDIQDQAFKKQVLNQAQKLKTRAGDFSKKVFEILEKREK
jgi:ABC-type sugar transport system ATPase subunit